MLVEVELVIVPLVAVNNVGLSIPIDKLVIVADVIVAFVPIKLVVFVVMELEVEALVVEAFEVAKLEVVPNSVAIVPLDAVKFVNTADNALTSDA